MTSRRCALCGRAATIGVTAYGHTGRVVDRNLTCDEHWPMTLRQVARWPRRESVLLAALPRRRAVDQPSLF